HSVAINPYKPEVKARNSGGRSSVFAAAVEVVSGTGERAEAVAVLALVGKREGMREQEELKKAEERKRVRRFVNSKRKWKKRFVERSLGL
ncbi:hypothetical protein CRG98_033590, partial [Punica granatum]